MKGKLTLSVADCNVNMDKQPFNRAWSHKCQKWCERSKGMYPAFQKACLAARNIPTREEFDRQWPPELDKVVYVQGRI